MLSILYVPRNIDSIFNLDLIEIDGWFKIMPNVLATGLPEDAPTLSLVPSNSSDQMFKFNVVARFYSPQKITNSGYGKTLKSGLVCTVPEEYFDRYADLCTKWNASDQREETWRKAVEFAKKVIA